MCAEYSAGLHAMLHVLMLVVLPDAEKPERSFSSV